jgi:hypothetical protein
VGEKGRIPLGIYRGLRFGLVLNPLSPAEVYLEGALTCQAGLLREHQGPRAILNAVERLAGGYPSECARVRQDLSIAESQLRDYQARLGQPFVHEPLLSELTTLRDQLKACLAGTNPEPGSEPRATVTELAEQIQKLRAANAVETPPDRPRKSYSSAEEPVTARIRRRMEAALAPQTPTEPDAGR